MNNEIINKDAQVAVANVDNMMIDDEGTKQDVVSSVKDQVTDEGIDLLLEKRISLTRKALNDTLVKLNEVLGDDATSERCDELNEKANRLQEQLDMAVARRDKKLKGGATKVSIPKNIPLMQIFGDVDVRPGHVVYAHINRFLSTFEMIVVNQNGITLETHWEACMINAVVHSEDKTTWFQQRILGQKLTWDAAKALIVKKYQGEDVKGRNMQELMTFTPRAKENPLQAIDRFKNCMKEARYEDSEIIGDVLIRMLDAYYPDLSSNIRQTNFLQLTTTGRPLNVEFIDDAAPRLYSTVQPIFGQGGLSASQYAPNHSIGSNVAEGSKDAARRGKQRDNNNYEGGNQDAGGRIRSQGRRHGKDKQPYSKHKEYRVEAGDKQRLRSEGRCFHCTKMWSKGHQCQERKDHQEAHNREFKMRAVQRKEAKKGKDKAQQQQQQQEVLDEPMEVSSTEVSQGVVEEWATEEGRAAIRARCRAEGADEQRMQLDISTQACLDLGIPVDVNNLEIKDVDMEDFDLE
ncbi:unnamed protein product [Absidia cylindrospora]